MNTLIVTSRPFKRPEKAKGSSSSSTTLANRLKPAAPSPRASTAVARADWLHTSLRRDSARRLAVLALPESSCQSRAGRGAERRLASEASRGELAPLLFIIRYLTRAFYGFSTRDRDLPPGDGGHGFWALRYFIKIFVLVFLCLKVIVRDPRTASALMMVEVGFFSSFFSSSFLSHPRAPPTTPSQPWREPDGADVTVSERLSTLLWNYAL